MRPPRSFSYPYPVLSPLTDDHPECSYAVTVASEISEAAGEWLIPQRHRLECTELLEAAAAGRACYAVGVSQPQVLYRETVTAAPGESEHLISLPAADFSDNRQIILSPFVVDTRGGPWNIGDHYHPEYRLPDNLSFTPGCGGRLAEANEIKIAPPEISPRSVVDLVEVNFLPGRGRFAVDLESDRIKIEVSPEDHRRLQEVMGGTQEPLLASALYLPALVEAVRSLDKHRGKRWAESVRTALDKLDGAPPDNTDLAGDALKWAQALLEHPLAQLVDRLMPDDDWEAPL